MLFKGQKSFCPEGYHGQLKSYIEMSAIARKTNELVNVSFTQGFIIESLGGLNFH